MLRSKFVIAALLLVFLFASTTGAKGPATPPTGSPGEMYVPGEILVKFKANAGPQTRAAARAQVAGVKLRTFRSRAEHWRLGNGVGVEHAIQRLRSNPLVQYAEPNYILTAEVAPTDPRYPELWGMNNTGQTGGTPGSDIDAERAWNRSTGSSSVVVAVIDTGIDYNHPDLAANVWTNPGEIAGNGIDDDGNGFIDDIHGWDFYNNDSDPFDDNGHGSHVSGTIGAVANNGVGVAGVAWNVRIMALKFLSSGGSGTTAGAISSVDYATAQGVDIMSNSWGGGSFSQALLDSINDAAAADIVFVAAAGNSSSDNDVTPHYPSSYDAPNIIAVMATDNRDVRSFWPSCSCSSNIGATSVDIAAPGTDILSTTPGNTYSLYSGTSMATPHVSGAAALLRSVVPTISAPLVRQVLMDMSDHIPGLVGQNASGGRLNAFFPIAEPDNTPPGAISDLATTSATSNSLFIAWTATGDDGGVGTASTYDIRYSLSPITEANFASATPALGAPAPEASGTPQSMEVTALGNGTLYYFAIKVGDEWGNKGPISNVASGTTLPPPTIFTSVDPDPLEFHLFTGQTGAGTLAITNAAAGTTLDWVVPVPMVGGATLVSGETLDLGKGEPDPRQNVPVANGLGGPDTFGYRWMDSNEPGGPSFSWTDISGTGTTIAELTGDDQISNPIPLGFNFSFYGNTFNSVRVSTNGWLSFTSTIASGTFSYSNQLLPTGGASYPENMLAPFWDDLNFSGSAHAVYRTDGSRFIVQYTNVPRYLETGSSLTFQVEIDNTGEIYYRYNTVVGTLNLCTVGIQNATRDDGLTVAFNAAYLEDALAIRIAAIPQWLNAAPNSGRLNGLESATVGVTVDASGLDGGTYLGTVSVRSNDPLNPIVDQQVTMIVTGAPAIDAAPSPIDFGEVYTTYSALRTLQVNNTGTDTLNVSSITSGNPTVTVSPSSFSLPPHSGQAVTVTYHPLVPSTLASALTITSNASNAPSLVVPVAGTAVSPPIMLVDPTSYSETLFTGGFVSRNLRITNTGGSALNVSLSADLGSLDADGVNIERAGGPDAGGYRYIDSDSAGGPVFSWFDISTIGTPITALTGDDQNAAITLPFPFPFYGGSFTGLRVCTNGWLSFTNTGTSLSNPTTLPNAGSGVPENLLAPFYDDLHFRAVQRARYYNDTVNGRFVVQYTDVDKFSPSGAHLTFQVMLYPNGKIRFQYLTMTGTLNSATIGIQNSTRTIGLLVSANENYVHNNLAIEFSRIPDWLEVSPTSGSIPAGQFRDFNVRFNAGGSGDRVFTGDVRIATNLPSPNNLRLVPATLTVIGVADVDTAPHSYNYGTQFVGYPHVTQLAVKNVGTAILNLLSISSNDAALTVTESGPTAVIPIPPGGQVLYDLRWLPTDAGPLNAIITVESDDVDEHFVTVPVTGNAIMPPILGYTPPSFARHLFVGEESLPGEHVLHITNTGGSNLTWSLGVRLSGAVVVSTEPVDLEKGEEPKDSGLEQTLGAGGPDMFGYSWKDSDEPSGPVFNWFDISSIGTPFVVTGDDALSAAVPIGFAFPYYGNTFTTVKASTNGWLSFTSTVTSGSFSYTNQVLPTGGTSYPENLLAAFWDDLTFSTSQKARYYNDGSRFIVQYTDVDRLGGSSHLTFQVILYPSGKIVYQYLTMTSPVLNSATIGIQNATRTDGLTVDFNQVYVHNNLAIQFSALSEWLKASPTGGTIPVGGSVDVDIQFDARELIGGVYAGGLTLATNDPAAALNEIPAILSVTGYPDIHANPASLDYGTVFVGVTSSQNVVISNPGSDVLDVTNIAVSGAYTTDTTPFSLPVNGSRTLTVVFAPTTEGPHPGSIVFTSNATGLPEFTVPLTGNGLFPPIAGVDPASIAAAAPPGGSKMKHLDLCNTGGSDLIWSADVELAPNGMAAVPPPQPEPELVKGDNSRDGMNNWIERVGGPDGFGYRFRDSDEPGGPVFDWFDISTIGTPIVTGTSGDDVNVAGIPIGFSFPYYGTMFSTVNFCTNGWISFTSTLTSFSNAALPTGGTTYPENMIAPFWDDLDFNGATKGHYYTDGSRFIVQWTNVEHYPSGSSYTFQIILYPDGTIRYQYLTMSGTLDSHTIGIQDSTRTIGLTASYNEAPPYVHDNLAIEFYKVPDWLQIDPTSGVLSAGQCTDITLMMSAANLADGDWDATISIVSNDPFHSPITVPVRLHVGEVALTWFDMDPNSLNLNSNGNTVKGTIQLPLPYDPHNIDLTTVCLFGGQLCALPSFSGFTDDNHDGIQELIVKFDRIAFEALCPEGNDVPITVTGEVRDTTWFTGTDTIRAFRPMVHQPNGHEYLVAGTVVSINWSAPQGATASSYHVWLSRDGGENWEVLATGVSQTSYNWTVAGAATDQARIRVFALDNRGVMGYDTSDADFSIASALFAPRAIGELLVRVSGQGLVLDWKRPTADLNHGPVGYYRVLRATAPQGPFVEIGAPTLESFTDTLASTVNDAAVFYKVTAVNTGGETD